MLAADPESEGVEGPYCRPGAGVSPSMAVWYRPVSYLFGGTPFLYGVSVEAADTRETGGSEHSGSPAVNVAGTEGAGRSYGCQVKESY